MRTLLIFGKIREPPSYYRIVLSKKKKKKRSSISTCLHLLRSKKDPAPKNGITKISKIGRASILQCGIY